MLHRSIEVMKFQLLQAIFAPRIPLICGVVAIFIFGTVQPIGEFAHFMQVKVTPWAFPHVTNDYICQLVIMSGIVLIFCDAPFKGESYQYIVTRAGNMAWSFGMCLYIILLSLLFVLFILIISTVSLFPNIDFKLSWGKIWGTLARTSAGNDFRLPLIPNDYTIGAYTPCEALGCAFILEWLCCVWLGLFIYFLNSLTGKIIGAFGAAGFVFMDITTWNDWSRICFKVSPVTMAQIHNLAGPNSATGIDFSYAIYFFLISLALLVSLCILCPFLNKRCADSS